MGEIAEMMLDGILDEQTGEYIGEAVGYPRTRYSRKKTDNSNNAKIRGINKWLAKHKIKGQTTLIHRYRDEQCTHLSKNKYTSTNSMKIHISGFCFNHFTSWVLKEKEKEIVS